MKKILFLSVLAALTAFTACKEDKNEDPIDVNFSSAEANGSEKLTTTEITLSFSRDIAGLTASDITLTGSTATKGTLDPKGDGVYTLALSGVAETASVTVGVQKNGYKFTPPSRTVSIHYAAPVTGKEVKFESAVANGSETETTTSVVLTFSEDIDGLSADDISLMDASARMGGLSSEGNGVYTLGLRNVKETEKITVQIAKEGYTFTPSSLTADVYYYEIPEPVYVNFVSVSANGDRYQTTSAITFKFGKEVIGFSADDVTITGTAASKGDVTYLGENTYVLAVQDIEETTTITVTLNKNGYIFSPIRQNVKVYYFDTALATPVSFISATANGSQDELTTEVTLTFDKEIDLLSIDDISIPEDIADKYYIVNRWKGVYTLFL